MLPVGLIRSLDFALVVGAEAGWGVVRFDVVGAREVLRLMPLGPSGVALAASGMLGGGGFE